jgi:hypothetical protein
MKRNETNELLNALVSSTNDKIDEAQTPGVRQEASHSPKKIGVCST